MFIAAMSTITKLWKEPRCPSTDECIRKMWYIYTMEYYAAFKNVQGYVHNNVHYKIIIVKSCDKENVHQ